LDDPSPTISTPIEVDSKERGRGDSGPCFALEPGPLLRFDSWSWERFMFNRGRIALNSSTVPVAKKMGFTELVYIPDLGVEVQGNGFATMRGYR
jgi:hypothetical protein